LTIKDLGIKPFSKLLVLTSESTKSNILEKGELKLLKEWFECSSIKLDLKFQATQDGWDYKTYFDLCEGVPNCIIFCKSTLGKRFGGYRSFPVSKKGGYKKDMESFLFSLTF